MINEVDADGSGVIEFDEFVHMIVLRMEKAMMEDEKQVPTFLRWAIRATLSTRCSLLN